MNNLQFLEEKIAELKSQGVYRKLPINTGPCANVIYFNGEEIVNLSSNNYLGFANHPRVIKAAKDALDHYGAGAGRVRSLVGYQDLLEVCDKVLAEF
jgi:glycine C-acetyltransferase